MAQQNEEKPKRLGLFGLIGKALNFLTFGIFGKLFQNRTGRSEIEKFYAENPECFDENGNPIDPTVEPVKASEISAVKGDESHPAVQEASAEKTSSSAKDSTAEEHEKGE